MTNALLIIDVQNDFTEGGSLAVADGNAVAQKIRDFLFNSPPEYNFIVTTQDWHINPGDHWSETPDFASSWPKHCAANTSGAELHELIQDFNFDEQFHKGKFSAAYSGFEGIGLKSQYTLAEWLEEREVTEVDIVGIATDYCVKATALDAAKYGFITTVLHDLTAAVSPESEKTAIDEMRDAGVYVTS